ncbi:MAG: ribosome small subunit-dependent GTPase A [Nitrospinae bacterium]|nr:ribosome small subunit-dependent GTPase A [Nitrospinota bacterium]
MAPNKQESRAAGRVIAHYGLRVHIRTDEGVVEWKPPRRETWVVGDMVVFQDGRPKTILPRKTELARLSFSGASQVLASNLTKMVIVTAAGPAFKPGLIDRFCVAASHAGLSASIALNKIDLPGAEEFAAAARRFEKWGIEVNAVSVRTGEGLNGLAESLRGHVSVMVGQSGVGKTSILNHIAGGAARAVSEVNEKTGAGKHTTTVSILVELPCGGALIDSPGIRQFVPSGLEPRDVADHFPGFEKLRGGCKFRDCLHTAEPGCAVRDAVKQGALDDERYQSYIRLLESVKQHSEPEW